MITPHDTLRDVVALVGGGIAERSIDDPELSRAVSAVMDDLHTAQQDDVVTAFLGVIISLVDRLARITNETPEEYWSHTAAGVSARLAEMENQA